MRQYSWALQQDDPERLCADRELVTREIHVHNDYYGQASVLKRYAGLSEETSLRLVVEHGIHLDDLVWQLDADAPLPMILACTPWRAEVLRAKSRKDVRVTGFGYVYAQELVRRLYGTDPSDDERRGTLAFPCHSTQSIRAKFDHSDYAMRLVELPAEMQPAVVCAYWKDYRDGAMQPYQDAGLTIVTCGHMYDPDFMLRLHDLSRQFRYSVSNAIGTHLFLSAASGCRFAYLDSTPVEFSIPENERQHCGQFQPMFQQIEAESRRLFTSPLPGAVPSPELDATQREFIERFVGARYRLSTSQLRQLIAHATRLDRFVPRSVILASGQRVVAPPALARRMGKPLRRLAKITQSIRKRLPGARKAA